MTALHRVTVAAITMGLVAALATGPAHASNHLFTVTVTKLIAPNVPPPAQAQFYRFRLVVEVKADPGCRGLIILTGVSTHTFADGREATGHIFHVTYPASSYPVPRAGFVDDFSLSPGDRVVVRNLEAVCGDTMPGDNRGTAPGPYAYIAPGGGPPEPTRPPQARFTSGEKVALKKAARDNQRLSAMWGTGGVGCAIAGLASTGPGAPLAAGLCVVIVGAGTGTTAYVAQDFDELADDPPDPDFRTFAATVRRATPAVPGDWPNLIREPLTALLEQYSAMRAEAHALLASLYKADGAQQARDAFWEGEQNSAAGRHARVLADLVDGAAARREALARAVEANGLAVSWDADAVRRAQDEMIAQDKPLPAAFVDTLRSSGLSEEEIGYVRDGFLLAQPSEVSGSLAGLLRVPELTISEHEVAGALRRFAGDADCLLPGGIPDFDGDGRRDACDPDVDGDLVDKPAIRGPSFAGRVRVSSRGIFTVPRQTVDCTGSGPDCAVKAAVTGSVRAIGRSIGPRGRRTVKYGGNSFKVNAGTTGNIKVTLTRKGFKRLKRLKKTRAKVTIKVTRGGTSAKKSVKLTLKAPKRARN
jgi:hypothetical protein